MRGNALMVAVIMIGIMVAMFVGYGLRLSLFDGGEGSLQKTSLQSSMYAMGHSFDAARLYLDTSLDYSVYQACHDNLRNSGLSAKSGIQEPLAMSGNDFFSELGGTITAYMDRYTSQNYLFLSEYSVSLPGSFIEVVPGEGHSFRVYSMPSDMMETSRLTDSGEYITLRAYAGTYSEYDLPCYPLFLKGQELMPSIKASLEGMLENAEPGISRMINESHTSCDSVGECGDLTEYLGEVIINTAASTPTDPQYLIESNINDYSVKIETVDKSNGEMTLTASIVQQITISEKEPSYYPVWNGEDTAFDAMRLVFNTTASRTFTS